MVVGFFFPQGKTVQRTRTKPISCVFAVVIVVAVSQTIFSDALLNQGFTRSNLPTSFDRSDLIGLGNDSAHAVFRARSVLFASVKSTNKNAKKRKPKHLRKKKTNDSSSFNADSKAKAPGRSISEEELQRHLNSKINYGKNGRVGPRARTRGIIKMEDDNTGDSTKYTSDRQRDQQFFLSQLNNRPTLVLNADYMPLGYMPLSLWSWQDAVKATFKGTVTVVDVYPDLIVRASNIKIPLPSVIALNDYVPQKRTRPAFTRRNVYLRDEYICQYCNKRFHTADLSLDHVVPRSMGGPLSWENVVTCCKACNTKKGSTPLSDIGRLGMELNRKPRCPTQKELAEISGRMVPKRVHPTWKPYLPIQEQSAASNRDSNKNEANKNRFSDKKLP